MFRNKRRSIMLKIGLDIGSTTIKCVVLDDDKIIYQTYERHYSQIMEKAYDLLTKIKETVSIDKVALSISGSAGMGLAEGIHIPFVQEVYATRIAANKLINNPDCIIELGGEDAKILFLSGGMEVRMNGSCAGGTGAFIDQMATLLNISHAEMNELSKKHEKIYSIASRCGVFAKSDIQPLLNQGANKADISKSIFLSVVNQTIAGLAQGRKIEGNVIYLGGPLTFLSELRETFDETLYIKGICPENSLYFVALGAALANNEIISLDEVLENLKNYKFQGNYNNVPPLFTNQEEYEEFINRHHKNCVEKGTLSEYKGPVSIGIDAGSTTVKVAVTDLEGRLLYSEYQTNGGNPIPIIREFIMDFYKKYPDITVHSTAVTGYGEQLIKSAFNVDLGVVETVAHYTAAKKFMPNVDFIIDIGGQDIKCFKIKNGAIDNIFLNEACSSGCGSFLQTFANALGYSISDFAKLGLFADRPVDLGSRCTVFMNSSVKQAQKDGASIENISAGLSISIVKNALYKVIRATSKESLGENIVVQGGTFYNDAVLRAFEKELNLEVVRPDISGIMGAYGAALYAISRVKESKLITAKELASFSHTVRTANCGLCSNNCHLAVNDFGFGKRYISGNRCERPVTKKTTNTDLNLYEIKRNILSEYFEYNNGPRKITIGFPMGLNFYELLPFWYKFFTTLGFNVKTSGFSSRELYIDGQSSIPSDTVCFPAKLIHGHVEKLIKEGIDFIFYPCLSYNIDEGLGDNHYNCPVVAYYPEVIKNNMEDIQKIKFFNQYLGIHRPNELPKKLTPGLSLYFDNISEKEVAHALDLAYQEYHSYMERIRIAGEGIIQKARQLDMPIIVLAGRPYHVDPEINHGIDKLISSLNCAIITEDVISNRVSKFKVKVLNQWTYHSRLYAAAKYIGDVEDMNLIQLVSFGCGVDAITTDEVRRILEDKDKLYTQIKIDEITNLGAVKIRIRSMLAAIGRE